MKIEVLIDSSCKEPKIIILTDEMTDEITKIMKRLSDPYIDSLMVSSERGLRN